MRRADRHAFIGSPSIMRPFTALAIALAVTTAEQAFADQRSHAPAAHHEARSEGGAAHAPAGHAAENKATAAEEARAPSSAVEAQAVDVTDDLVKLSEESRNYKAGSTAVGTVKDMMDTLLRTVD